MMYEKMLIDVSQGSHCMTALRLCKLMQAELCAVTCCFGSDDCDVAVQEATALAENLKISVPIYGGAQQAILEPRLPSDIVRQDTRPSSAPAGLLAQKYAWDVIYSQAKDNDGQLTIVTLGALTNLAIALMKYENLAHYVKRIVMLAGSAGIGNATPYGETNVLRDPHACQIVLASGIPVTMIGLETVKSLEQRFQTTEDLGSALSLAIAIHPHIAETISYNVTVEMVHGELFGRTLVDTRRHSEAEKNIDLVTSVNLTDFGTFLQLNIP